MQSADIVLKSLGPTDGKGQRQELATRNKAQGKGTPVFEQLNLERLAPPQPLIQHQKLLQADPPPLQEDGAGQNRAPVPSETLRIVPAGTARSPPPQHHGKDANSNSQAPVLNGTLRIVEAEQPTYDSNGLPVAAHPLPKPIKKARQNNQGRDPVPSPDANIGDAQNGRAVAAHPPPKRKKKRRQNKHARGSVPNPDPKIGGLQEHATDSHGKPAAAHPLPKRKMKANQNNRQPVKPAAISSAPLMDLRLLESNADGQPSLPEETPKYKFVMGDQKERILEWNLGIGTINTSIANLRMVEGWEIAIGCTVRVDGLKSRPQLNGAQGVVRAQKGDRWQVKLDADAKMISLKQANLTIVAPSPGKEPQIHEGSKLGEQTKGSNGMPTAALPPTLRKKKAAQQNRTSVPIQDAGDGGPRAPPQLKKDANPKRSSAVPVAGQDQRIFEVRPPPRQKKGGNRKRSPAPAVAGQTQRAVEGRPPPRRKKGANRSYEVVPLRSSAILPSYDAPLSPTQEVLEAASGNEGKEGMLLYNIPFVNPNGDVDGSITLPSQQFMGFTFSNI